MAMDEKKQANTKLAKFLIREFEKSQGIRRLWESNWQEIAELVRQNSDFTVHLARGAKRHNQLYDSIGIWANDKFASGLSSFLTNAAMTWFFLKIEDNMAMEDPEVKAWLFVVRDLMLSLFVSPKANFHPNAHEFYLDLGAFGTAAMWVSEDDEAGIGFTTRPLAEIFIRENHRGMVDTVYRFFHMTGRQAKQFYGEDAIPDEMKKSLEKEPEKMYKFLHVVRPNDDFNPSTRFTSKKVQSVHILYDKNLILRKGGFDEMPFLIARWTKVAGEVYGRSPGMQALPDLKMIQAMSKTILKAAQKATDPAIAIPDDGFLGPFRTAPNSVNYYRAGAVSGEDIRVLEHRGRIDIGNDMMEQRREMIGRAFFVDQLQNVASRGDKSPLTATEVMQRREETLRTMSPQVTRMQAEFLGPLIERTFNLMARAGMIPPAPERIRGQELKVEFVSPAFLAQRTSEVDNITRWVQLVTPVAQTDPQTLALVFNTEEYIRTTADLLNIPPELVNSPKVVEQARQQMMKMQQMQQQTEMLRAAGEAEQSMGAGATAMKDAPPVEEEA